LRGRHHRPPRNLEPPGSTDPGRATFARRPATPDSAPVTHRSTNPFLGARLLRRRPHAPEEPRSWLPSRSPSPRTKLASRRVAPCRPRSTRGS